MKALTWLVSLVASIAVLTGSAAAQCTRHFYNNSPGTVHLHRAQFGVVQRHAEPMHHQPAHDLDTDLFAVPGRQRHNRLGLRLKVLFTASGTFTTTPM